MLLKDLPLSFLPAFEAAGRLGSFVAAAAELHVTPSAISQQVRTLEDALGIALFERSGRSVVLTQDGKGYLREVQHSLGELAASTARLCRRTRGNALKLTTLSLAAHEFLLPRLAAFSACFPDIELRIESSNDYVDFRMSDCDAAIRLGSAWPELTSRPFGTLGFALVCAPALAATIHEPADLAHHTLLDPCGTGQRLLDALLADEGGSPRVAKTWTFQTCHETLRAAEHGLGVTCAAFPIATEWVRSGRLAVPLAQRLNAPGSICLAYRNTDEARFPFAEIAAWLEREYAALPALASGRVCPELTVRLGA